MTATALTARRSGRRVTWTLTGLCAVPALVLLFRVVRSRWLSTSDWAAIELRTRDVGTLRTPLVGPYSRYGWNHPGPLLFYVLAVPYRLLGSQPHGILAGALMINAAAIGCIGVVCWRRGNVGGLTLGLLVVLLVVRTLGAAFLVDPWNPYVIVVPLFALVCLAWDAMNGDLWALPVAVGVASFVAQSHVGVAFAAAGIVGAAVVIIVVDAWRQGIARLKTVAIASFVVGLACWTPPVVQQLQRGPGNIGELLLFWRQPHASTVGWSAGARIVGQQLSVPAPWLSGHEAMNIIGGADPHWHAPIALLALFGAAAVGFRRHDRQSLTLDLLALVVVLAAVFSAAHIVDTPYVYLVRWMWVIGAIVWLAVLWTAWRALPAGIGRAITASRLPTVAVAALAVWLTVTAVHAGFPAQTDQKTLAAIAPAVRHELGGLRAPVLLESPPDFVSALTAVGVLAVAIHAGIDARLTEQSTGVVGSAHTISDASARSVVVVATDDEINRYLHNPAYRSLAHFDPLSAGQRASHTAFDIAAQRALFGPRADPEAWLAAHRADLARMHQFDARGPGIEMFLETVPRTP